MSLVVHANEEYGAIFGNSRVKIEITVGCNHLYFWMQPLCCANLAEVFNELCQVPFCRDEESGVGEIGER